MQLSRHAFEKSYEDGTLRLAFIGMSNIGKSYTAMRLARYFNFDLIEVDKLIREDLGHNDMDAFAKWQGQPFSEGYLERETQSIALEAKAIQRAMHIQGGNRILDTPGSVIYTGKETIETLKRTHFIVYIEAADDIVESLKLNYFKNPKPLIWKGIFESKAGQSNEEAILESYPKLLKTRSAAYEKLADHTLSSDFILDLNVKTNAIFEALKPAV